VNIFSKLTAVYMIMKYQDLYIYGQSRESVRNSLMN